MDNNKKIKPLILISLHSHKGKCSRRTVSSPSNHNHPCASARENVEGGKLVKKYNKYKMIH